MASQFPRTWWGGTLTYLSILVIASRARPSAVVVPVPRRKELPRLVLRLGGQPLLLRLSGGLVLFMGLESGAASLRSDEGSVPKSLVGVPGKEGKLMFVSSHHSHFCFLAYFSRL